MALLALLSAPAPATAQGMAQFIPPASAGCPSNVKVQLQAESSPGNGWNGPTISGRATVLNGETYSVPVQSVYIMAFPSNSAVGPVYADCRGVGNGQRVPSSPVPYQYGKASCTFSANLPTNGPSAGARNWQQAKAVVVLTNGAKCQGDMVYVDRHGNSGGGSWDNNNNIGGVIGSGVGSSVGASITSELGLGNGIGSVIGQGVGSAIGNRIVGRKMLQERTAAVNSIL
jgi:hypothetical protein